MVKVDTSLAKSVKDLVQNGIDLNAGRLHAAPDAFWANLHKTGTELWLDTGDIDEASKIWSHEMSALTTNNTLLNKEVQKGIYDDFIKQANNVLSDLSLDERILEIAFILNARHGLRLVQRFGGKVSVELHTALADDLEATVAYGLRYFEICPEHFIVKVPLTATGLLGARTLRENGVPINFTLEFSARQNALVSLVAKPNYCNVFLGRLNAYVSGNGLGDGNWVGEKATIASQAIIRKLTGSRKEPTRQIAASLRSADQLEHLAGVDVFTMPTKVAHDGHDQLGGNFTDKTGENYHVTLAPGIKDDDVRIEKLWDVPPEVVKLGQSIDQNPPRDGEELVVRARQAGCADMFPDLSDEDYGFLSSEGKIPKHARWQSRIRDGKLAIDTLLNIAGLASFAADQAELDSRVRKLIA